MQDRLLLFLELRQLRVLLLRVLFPLQFDLADSFFDRRNPKRDFLLFLLQFLEGDDLVADFGKIDGLRRAFAAEIDLALLQDAFLVAQCHPRFLPANLQPDLAQPCANETHGIRLALGALVPSAIARRAYSSSALSFARTVKSSSVVVSPVTALPLATSFSNRRMIFPLRVFGNASANRISSGFAMAPI